MRIGTFACWLFGHKFVYYPPYGYEDYKIPQCVDFCIRCGAKNIDNIKK